MADQVAADRGPADADAAGDITVAFYEREAETYFRRTLSNDLSEIHRLFLDRLPPGGLILDAGSGSGRDTLWFLEAGYRVEAFDASSRLAALAEEMTGIPVEVARFEEWRGGPSRYDGIWCFASLLHVREHMLPAVLQRLGTSLRPGGSLFASFKHGHGSTVDRTGRRFTNLTSDAARSLLDEVGSLQLSDVWEESGPTALGDPTNWVHMLCHRTS